MNKLLDLLYIKRFQLIVETSYIILNVKYL